VKGSWKKRELALFNLALDSKLQGSDSTKLKVSDVCHGNIVSKRAIFLQQKTNNLFNLKLQNKLGILFLN